MIPQDGVVSYFAKIGYPCPRHMNPADHAINIISTDFDVAVPNHERIQQLAEAWIAHTSNLNPLGSELDKRSSVGITSTSPGTTLGGVKTAFEPEQIRTQKSWNYRVVAELRRTWILTQRTALIIRRNVMLTGLRLFMYGAWVMALMPISIGLKILKRERGYECTAGDSVVTYGKDGCQGQ
jgi:ATP-binding cassette, subfamily G (WHITE), member 2